MKSVWVLALAAGAGWAQAGPPQREGGYWVQTTSGSLPVNASRVRVAASANIYLRGVDSNTLNFQIRKRVKARSQEEARRVLEQYELKSGTREGQLIVIFRGPGRSRGSAEVALTGPRGLRGYVLESDGGNVEAYDIAGTVESVSAGGNIQMDRIGSGVVVRTGGGAVRLGVVHGPVRCFTGGGRIEVDHAGGESWFETAGGEIHIRESAGPVHASTGGGNIQVDRAAAGVSAHTAGGVIEVGNAGGPVTAETSGGAIAIQNAKGVRCESAAGGIRLKRVSGALRASTSMGSILADLLAGAMIEDSFLNTGSGDITVFIPSNLAVTVRARSESAERIGRIISEFPEIRIDSAGFERPTPVVAEGRLNGGGPLLKLVVSGGTIYLKRQR